MQKINTVLDGEYVGKEIISILGTIYIVTSFWGRIEVNKKNIRHVNILEEKLINGKQAIIAEIHLNSGKKSTILVDRNIAHKVLSIWPSCKKNRLERLLKEGYSIVGFSSCFLGGAFGTSTFLGTAVAGLKKMHTILLQKGSNIEIVTILDDGGQEILGSSNIVISN